MDTIGSPGFLLALASALFLLGCGIGAFWPHRWHLALVAILPATVLTVWLVFGDDLRALVASLRQPPAAEGAAAATTPR